MIDGFRLHHIGYLVRDIDAAAEMFVRRFGYRIEGPAVEDPEQTAHVQLLRLSGARVWLELVSPRGQKSKLSRALDEEGEGLHHHCYEVDNIERACEHLRREQMLMLSAPTPAVAFGGRRIAWLMDRARCLVELVESGEGPLTLDSLKAKKT